MTGDEFREALLQAGLSHTAAADLFGVATRTIRRMGSGRHRVPYDVEMMLREIIEAKARELE